MIFYGTKASRLKNGQINHVTCPNCQNQTSMNYGIFGKYFYIYWIPIFPIGKTNIVECNHCKKTFKLKELPQQIKHKFELVKHKGTPLWHFTGLAIILLAVGYFSYSNAKHKEDEVVFIKEPAIGDIYSYKDPDSGNFSTMKVINVSRDSIRVVYNDYLVDKRTGISKIDKASNYNDTTENLSRLEIVVLYNDNVIYNINRH
ncbi:zinc-ribbon domain-containing protein [Seonamhaeicola algicola]|uniref:Zinc-ribbon domain-containing protein n=2 Tax=Seonamhaeicola TaxID=1649495 RepID=A0A5C7AGK3_9FLAO|nr:zinc-ribbon domain-containing protein [Seonamhaeicola algicola]TXE07114.1 zinc-ribbon domain-containing protein [Seonamhaeicola algicola]